MSSKKKTAAMKEEATPALVPKLRFPEFRESATWAARTLGKFLIERIEYPQEPVPLFSLTIEDGVTPKTERYERAFLVKDTKDAYKLMLPDDFAFNPMNLRFGAIGRHSGSEAVAVSKYYNIFFCDPTADARFCEFYFRSDAMIAFYDNMAIGSLIEKRRVHFSDFLKFNIPFPPPAEQQKIAECLSSVDELMAAQGRKVDALKTHKKGLMQQLFPRKGETQPRLRFPEFQNDRDWEIKRLDQLVDIQSGATPSKANPAFWNGSVPWVSAKDMKRLFLDDSEDHISTAAVEDGARLVPSGTLLMLTRGMTLLKDIPICVALREMSFNQDVKGLRPKESVDGRFLAWMLIGNKERILDMVNVAGHGTGKLDTEELKAMELMLPSPNEQQRIASCLSSLDVLITAETQKLEALKTHKRGLMQQLFPSSETQNTI